MVQCAMVLLRLWITTDVEKRLVSCSRCCVSLKWSVTEWWRGRTGDAAVLERVRVLQCGTRLPREAVFAELWPTSALSCRSVRDSLETRGVERLDFKKSRTSRCGSTLATCRRSTQAATNARKCAFIYTQDASLCSGRATPRNKPLQAPCMSRASATRGRTSHHPGAGSALRRCDRRA